MRTELMSTMNIEDQPLEVQWEHLLAQLEETSGDSDERRTLWQTFYYDVGAHAAAEELTFYSGLIAKSDGQPEGRHSVAEHHELDEIIQELNEMEMSSPGWLTRFKTLKDRYEHHIEEEEGELFTKAKRVLARDDAEAIAETIEAFKEEHTEMSAEG